MTIQFHLNALIPFKEFSSAQYEQLGNEFYHAAYKLLARQVYRGQNNFTRKYYIFQAKISIFCFLNKV